MPSSSKPHLFNPFSVTSRQYLKPHEVISSCSLSFLKRSKIVQAYICIMTVLCIKTHFTVLYVYYGNFKEVLDLLWVQCLSCWPLLFVSPKETIYAPHPCLLSAQLLHFLSIAPHCLLRFPILPVNYSAQSLPPTEALSPPPQEMNDWQVCSVSNIPPINKRKGNMDVFLHQRGKCKR